MFHRRGGTTNSEKHEITWSLLAADQGAATQTILFAKGVSLGDVTAANEVGIGHKVKYVFIEMNISAETITNPKVVHWTINFNPAGAAIIGNPLTYNPAGKKYIIHRGMEMLPKDVATVFKRVFVVKIPPKYQRIGDGDDLELQLRCSSTEAINFCGFAIYKEIS